MEKPAELSDDFFRQLFEKAIDGYIVLTSDLRIAYMNQTARSWFGDISGESGVFCGDILNCHDDHGHSMLSIGCLGCIVRERQTSLGDRQMNVTPAGGKPIPVSVSYSYIPADSGEPWIMMAMRDVTVQKQWQQERLQNESLNLTLAERERIARDLHDTVAQNLAYGAMQLSLLKKTCESAPLLKSAVILEHLETISEAVDQSIQELRNSLYDLNFHLETDLVGFIRDSALRLELRSGIETHVAIRDSGSPWPIRDEIQLARMVQEIMTNIRKHSRATQVQIELVRTQELLLLTVQDDGCGFDPEAVHKEQGHFGLQSIVERSRLLGGVSSVVSGSESGTVWTIRLPRPSDQLASVVQQ
ncbi:MAG: PAS domain-containing sensor histidine kinase [Bacilli bacterium]